MSKLNILSNLSILTKLVYNIAHDFPDIEKFGLYSQTTRAMISVRLNIREGNSYLDNNKIRFFYIAKGSLEEVDECMLIAYELQYISKEQLNEFREKYWHSFNMLKKLISSISSERNKVE